MAFEVRDALRAKVIETLISTFPYLLCRREVIFPLSTLHTYYKIEFRKNQILIRKLQLTKFYQIGNFWEAAQLTDPA